MSSYYYYYLLWLTGRSDPLGRRLECTDNTPAYHTVLLTGVRRTIRPGGPTRTSADASVPRLAGFSLIT